MHCIPIPAEGDIRHTHVSSANNQLANSVKKLACIIILLLGVMPLLAAEIYAQKPLAATVSPNPQYQGREVTLTVSLDEDTSAYYFETQIDYEADLLTFKGVESGELLKNPNTVATGENLDYNTIGASASRTDQENFSNQSGALLSLTFSVKNRAETETADFAFHDSKLLKANEDEIAVTEPADAELTIQSAITDAGLADGTLSIHEAQTATIKAKVFAYTETDQDGQAQNITAEIGYHATKADPTEWSDSDWHEAEYLEDDGDYDVYQYEAGPGMEPGEYHYAVRYKLNDEYVIGGINGQDPGIYDGSTYTTGTLTVAERPAYRTKIAEWNFDDRDREADRYIQANEEALISINGSEFTEFDSENEGFALEADNWDVENADNPEAKFWSTTISAEGYESLEISSKQSGTGSSPKYFKIQTSLDGSAWEDLSSGSIEVGEDWEEGVVNKLSLPSELEGQSSVHIRWLRTDDKRIDQSGDSDPTISGSGNSQIDDILFTGIDTDPQPTTVWPGDTDQSGNVDQDDVAQLGTYWLFEGRSRIFRGSQWEALDATQWDPAAATYADTDGSGQVNQSDLLAIGLNYGKSTGGSASKSIASSSEPLSMMRLPQLAEHNKVRVTISASRDQHLQGITWALDVAGDAPVTLDHMDIEPRTAKSWLSTWSNEGKMLKFLHGTKRSWSGAWVHKGLTMPRTAAKLLTFDLTATNDWPDEAVLRLADLKLSDADGKLYTPNGLSLDYEVLVHVEEDQPGELPAKTVLKRNYPNPFNPSTTIRYELAERSDVTLTVFDLRGRRVATLIDDKPHRAGRYQIDWNAGQRASGIYFYRLQTKSSSHTRKMTLLK